MTHGSLFSGIGGFDLAAEMLGWQNVFQVEIDTYCQAVLAKNFPSVKRYSDIKNFDCDEYTGRIDVVSGGFPCQPFSRAGKRKGEADSRNLWSEMFRVIRTLKPTYVVCENVVGLADMALYNVLDNLASEHYETEIFIIPACAQNAPHRRDRLWIVAYPYIYGKDCEQNKSSKFSLHSKRHNTPTQQVRRHKQSRISESSFVFSNTENDRRGEFSIGDETQRFSGSGTPQLACSKPIHGGERSKPFAPEWWETEPPICRVVDGLPYRVDRLKGLGNAIVPQIAYQIFRCIQTLHTQT